MKTTVEMEGNTSPETRFFPFIDLKSGKMMFRPQMRLEGRCGKELILKAESLSPKKLGEKLRWLAVDHARAESLDRPTKDFAEAVELVGTYRVVGEGEVDSSSEVPIGATRAKYRIDVQFDRTLFRVPAKIAFNYFADCAIASGLESCLFAPWLDRIRAYIMTGVAESDFDFVRVCKTQVTLQGKTYKNGAPLHLLTVQEELGQVVVNVVLFNMHCYAVILGPYPFATAQSGKFGCSHFFNLVERSIRQLSPKEPFQMFEQ